MVSHTTDLAVDFGRKVRNLIATEAYNEIFPEVALAVDSKSAGRWNTNFGGEYFACGIGSALAGRGAIFCLLMILTLSRMLLTETSQCLIKPTSGYIWSAYSTNAGRQSGDCTDTLAHGRPHGR